VILIPQSYGQGVAINTDGSDPDRSAILDITSASQGILFPRMTLAERDAISNPAKGLVVYVTNDSLVSVYNGNEWVKYPVVNGDGDLYITGNVISDVLLDTLDNSSYRDVQDFVNLSQSAGMWDGCEITDNGDGTINVAAGNGLIKKTSSPTDTNFMFDLPAQSGISLTNDIINWIYVDYNNGDPVVKASTDFSSLDQYTEVIIGKVYKDGSDLHIMNVGQFFADYQRTTCFKDYEVFGFQRASGMMVSEVGTRNISVTSGVMYCSHNRLTSAALNTSTGDDFTYWYRDGSGGWTKSTANTQIDNTSYDDGSGTLATLSNSRYGVHWLFVTFDGELNVVYGQDSYKKKNAEAADVPTPPSILQNFSLLVGKIIIKKNDASATEVSSAFEEVFNYTTPSIHNDLAELQGGAAGEYYHLTAAEYAALGTKSTSNVITFSKNVGIGIDDPKRSLHVKDVIRLEPLDNPPDNPEAGDMYFDARKSRLRCYDGKRWRNAW
jgi:hypothetical protein